MRASHFLATFLFLAVQLSLRIVAAAPQGPAQKEQHAANGRALTNKRNARVFR